MRVRWADDATPRAASRRVSRPAAPPCDATTQADTDARSNMHAEGSRALTASHVGFECCWKSRVLMIVVDKGVVLMSRCWAADGRKR